MKKLYALCILTLATVLLDIVLFHSKTVRAQPGQNYTIQEVPIGKTFNLNAATVVVGISCIGGGQPPQCFVMWR